MGGVWVLGSSYQTIKKAEPQRIDAFLTKCGVREDS